MSGVDANGENECKTEWKTLIARQKLSAHRDHEYIIDNSDGFKYNRVKIIIYPDGGVSRLRVYGFVDKSNC